MAKFNIGDLVVLKSGSMRMCVESADDEAISTVWCNEGVIGRDRFDPALLNKWEYREDDGGRPRAPRGDREGGGGRKPPYRGDRDREERGERGGERGAKGGDERPRKTGWDGKPRQKKYFRKDED